MICAREMAVIKDLHVVSLAVFFSNPIRCIISVSLHQNTRIKKTSCVSLTGFLSVYILWYTHAVNRVTRAELSCVQYINISYRYYLSDEIFYAYFLHSNDFRTCSTHAGLFCSRFTQLLKTHPSNRAGVQQWRVPDCCIRSLFLSFVRGLFAWRSAVSQSFVSRRG